MQGRVTRRNKEHVFLGDGYMETFQLSVLPSGRSVRFRELIFSCPLCLQPGISSHLRYWPFSSHYCRQDHKYNILIPEQNIFKLNAPPLVSYFLPIFR